MMKNANVLEMYGVMTAKDVQLSKPSLTAIS